MFFASLLHPRSGNGAASFYSTRTSNQHDMAAAMVMPLEVTLGTISNQLAEVHTSLSTLSSKVDLLGNETKDLSKRLGSVEELARVSPSSKKRKIIQEVPRELSVSNE